MAQALHYVNQTVYKNNPDKLSANPRFLNFQGQKTDGVLAPGCQARRPQPSKSSSVRATTLVARRKSARSRRSSARLAWDSRTVRGPAP
jgi:hypothetical protein